jgi:menaquinone-dependent protoporphyrinogen IX oxidase
MKGIVAYDSVFGNTMRVAETIAEEIRAQGHEAEVIDLGKRIPRGVEGDIVFIGSPTRMGHMTSRTKKFVKRLKPEWWANRSVIAFDTMLRLPKEPEARRKALKWTEHGAGPRIRELAEERGLRVYERVLRVEVSGIKGPLVPQGLEQVKTFVREFLAESR